MIDNYGDSYVSNGTRQIDPALNFYSGVPHMSNTNKDTKEMRKNCALRT